MNDAARLWHLTRTVARQSDIAAIWPEFHAHARSLTGATTSVLLRIQAESGELIPISAAGLDHLQPQGWFASAAARAAADRTWREGVPLVFTDVPELRASLQAPAAMLVPVSSREGRLGLLALGLDEAATADGVQAKAGAVGELLALAFERIRLERDAGVQHELRALVSDVSRSTSSSLQLNTSLESFCDRTQRLFGCDAVSVWLHDRRKRSLAMVASSDPAELTRQSPVAADDEVNPWVKAMRAQQATLLSPRDGRGATMLVPLRGRRRALGTLAVEGVHLEPGDAPRVGEQFEEVGRQLSSAIESLWLLEDVLRSRRELEHTVNALADLVVVVDRRLCVTHANRAFGTRVGRGSDDVLNRPIGEFVGPEVAQWLHATVERGVPSRVQSKELSDSMLGAVFLFTVSALVGRDDDWSGLVIVARDLSEQARYQAERAELRDRLTQSEKLAALGQFVAGIAHELNNPLQGVLGHTELMLHTATGLTARTKRDLKLVFREADRAAKIVHNLLVFAGSRRITRRRLNVSLAVSRVLALREAACTAAGIEVVSELSRKLPRVGGDALLLQQAVLNIFINAEQALAEIADRPRRIEVTTARRGGSVQVRVADNGPGIPPDVLPRLFEPFFTTKEVGKGTGLGLAIAYGIAQEHGGELHAANRPEGGAVFTLQLPTGTDAVE